MSSKYLEPEEKATDVDDGEEGGGAFRVAGGHPPPAFQVQERIFHKVPELVEMLVVRPLLPAVLPGRDFRLHSPGLSLPQDGVRVVAPVGYEMLRPLAFQEFPGHRAIRCCALSHNDFHGHAVRVDGKVDFAVEPPFVRLAASFPPLAPVPCWWSFTWLASIISHSKSGSSMSK